MIHCCTHLLELLSRRASCVNWNGVSQAFHRLGPVFLQNAYFRSVDFQYLLFCAVSMARSIPGFVVPQAFAGCDGVNWIAPAQDKVERRRYSVNVLDLRVTAVAYQLFNNIAALWGVLKSHGSAVGIATGWKVTCNPSHAVHETPKL
jgi:hypothetical protein